MIAVLPPEVFPVGVGKLMSVTQSVVKPGAPGSQLSGLTPATGWTYRALSTNLSKQPPPPHYTRHVRLKPTAYKILWKLSS